MAAEIYELDQQVGTEMAWHGKTKVIENRPITKDDVYPYEIVRVPVKLESLDIEMAIRKSQGQPEMTEEEISTFVSQNQLVKGKTMLVCTDTRKPIGEALSDSYHAITFARFWDMIENSLGGTGSKIISAGTIMNRTTRFITAEIAGHEQFTVGDRVFKQNMTLLDSVDGRIKLHAINTTICTVCANTARMTLGDKSGAFQLSAKHTPNMPDRIKNIENAIENMVGVSAQFRLALQAANEEACSKEEAKNLFAGFLGEKALTPEGKLSTRTRSTVDRLVTLFETPSVGNRGQTLLDAFSGITDLYSHESSGGEDRPGFREKQWQSSEFGAASATKAEFLQSIIDFGNDGTKFRSINLASITRLQERGSKLLAMAN